MFICGQEVIINHQLNIVYKLGFNENVSSQRAFELPLKQK